jgi:hypothetical protein
MLKNELDLSEDLVSELVILLWPDFLPDMAEFLKLVDGLLIKPFTFEFVTCTKIG